MAAMDEEEMIRLAIEASMAMIDNDQAALQNKMLTEISSKQSLME